MPLFPKLFLPLGPARRRQRFHLLGTLNALLPRRGISSVRLWSFQSTRWMTFPDTQKKRRPESNGHSLPLIQAASDLLICSWYRVYSIPDTEHRPVGHSTLSANKKHHTGNMLRCQSLFCRIIFSVPMLRNFKCKKYADTNVHICFHKGPERSDGCRSVAAAGGRRSRPHLRRRCAAAAEQMCHAPLCPFL